MGRGTEVVVGVSSFVLCLVIVECSLSCDDNLLVHKPSSG